MTLRVVIDPVAPDRTRPTITLLHGFTQNAQCWGPFDNELAKTFRVERIDLPGHGQSYDDDADLDRAARLCLDAATGTFWVGYSLGGRVALHMALAAPSRCRGLVVIGAHPGISDAVERRERLRVDEERADHLEAIGTKRFVDEWLTLRLFAGLDASNDHRRSRYENRSEGLAASLRNCSTGRQRPLWDDLAALSMPVLYVAGGDDEKFVRLGRDFADRVGSNAQLATIGGSGHSCHLERPSQTATAVAAMMTSLPARSFTAANSDTAASSDPAANSDTAANSDPAANSDTAASCDPAASSDTAANSSDPASSNKQ